MTAVEGAAGTRDWRRAICGVCPAGCWVEVQVEGGRLRDIRAETGHPLGMICRRGEHAPEIVHSEHRLRTPLRRVGPKGSLDFEPCTWDEAYSRIVEQFELIKEESGPEALSIYTGRGTFELSLTDVFQPAGAAISSASNVLFPFGSPNTMGVGALCYVSFAMIAPHVTMGRMLIDMFSDIENAELLVVWGANPATDSPPLDMARLEAAAARGAEVVCIDPRRTDTAVRTGAQWVPIRPGTDGALALSMIKVMIDEDLHDDRFAREWTHGFDELARYVQHFSPEVCEHHTGVPAATVVDLARRIARADGACPIMYTGLEYSNSGIQAIRATHTLFALAGHLDVPGGMGLAMAGSHFPLRRAHLQANPDTGRALGRDRFPLYTHYREESHPLALIDAVLRGDPYPVRGLIVHGASLLTSWPQTPVWRETLEALDFLVCIDRQRTADMAYADVVLPATTGFEIDSYMTYGPIFRLREKIIEPVGEARNDYRIMAELADRLGYGELYPQSEEEVLRSVLEGSGHTLEAVREAGGTVKVDTPVMEYRKWEKGGLRPDGEPGFDTPTGRFEIASTLLADHGYDPLPRYTEPVEGPTARPDLTDDFPLVFNSGARPQTDFRSQHHGIQGLCRDHPEPTVDLNSADAVARGIETGDLVRVNTPRGSVPFRARVSENIVAGAVECSMGGGTPVGPRPWREWNVNLLTDVANYDEISGFPVYKALLCEVERIEAGDDDARSWAERSADLSAAPSSASHRPPEQQVYLDGSATTPMDSAVREAMLPFLEDEHGNPSSIHARGRQARDAMTQARRSVARLVGARPRQMIFTGGGSEADNLALKGVVLADPNGEGHVITSAIEHPAMLRACDWVESLGWEVTRLAPDAEGYVHPNALRDALRPTTRLVSIMAANNEVGTVQPVAALAAVAHEYGALFHTDAVQAVGRIAVDVDEWGVDLLSLSAHKFHGPKGVGALYVRDGVELVPLVHGGGQERGLRAGTENVAGIVGLGRAAELARMRLEEMTELARLRDRLHRGVEELLPEAVLNGPREHRLPNVLNLTLPGLRGESIVLAMDQRGVALSSGSACKAGSPEPTHVLLAMGCSEEQAHCSVRFSLCRGITAEHVDRVIDALAAVLDEMENTVRFLPCK